MRAKVDLGWIPIVLLCIGASIVYGIAHDMVTAHLCVEYFTIGHANVFGTGDPTVLALGWGVVATWWMGLFLGIPMAFAARFGARPKRSARSLVRPIGLLLLVMAVCALLAGLGGWYGASAGQLQPRGTLGARVPEDRHTAFLAVWFAHIASYLVGFAGGVALCFWVSLGRVSADARPRPR